MRPALVIEHNGDVYSCDHFVYPQFRLGNILRHGLAQMAGESLRTGFGKNKETSLPHWCRECEVLAACRGGCLKHRIARSPLQESGLQYLCPGYRKFFLHIRKYLRAMTTLLEHGYPASHVMEAVKGSLLLRSATPNNMDKTGNARPV